MHEHRYLENDSYDGMNNNFIVFVHAIKNLNDRVSCAVINFSVLFSFLQSIFFAFD